MRSGPGGDGLRSLEIQPLDDLRWTTSQRREVAANLVARFFAR
jgi:xanthine dehydrogenase iron-sulfur cluster and FAD-binding subunit A